MNHKLKEAFLDVLLYLFEYYSEDNDLEEDDDFEIRNKLKVAGFREDAIEHALDWVGIFKDSSSNNTIQKPGSKSIRVLNDEEKNLLDEECQNYILRLEKFGLLPPLKRELLIDKLTSIGFEPMDIEVLKALSILMLFQEPSIDVKLHSVEGEDLWEKPITLN